MIECTRIESVALVRMSHGKANAMDVELMVALRRALDEARRSGARAVVLTAAGAIFSAGVDLPRVLEGGRAYLAGFLAELSRGLRELFALPLPVVAAVNGHAIAGGCILACACDVRLMARGPGRIGVPELRVGVPFPMVPAEIMRYALGHQKAQLAMLAGNVVEAARAVEQGFIDELVEPGQLRERALAVAAMLGETPASSYARTKLDLRRPVFETWDRLAAVHDRETLEAWDSPMVHEAIRTFVAKTLRK